MNATSETSDGALLDLLRQREALGVSELALATGVTATAVRQRLNRLIGRGLVQRRLNRSGRGRPGHKYLLTTKGLRDTGTNFDDLAVALWKEIRSVTDPGVRRGLLRRIARGLAQTYRDNVHGETLAEKMRCLGELFEQRSVPLMVDQTGSPPTLTALACPYPGLADWDRSVCAMERMLFADLLDRDVKLAGCRLDGETCCTFEVPDA